jgi:hypothetical protein
MATKYDIIPGSQYGSWKIIKEAERKNRNGKKTRMVLVECKCGILKTLEARSVLKGFTSQCSKCRYTPDLSFIGRKFGSLSVIDFEKKNNSTYWVCVCVCGNRKSIRQYDLKSGNSLTCGCSKTRKGSDSIYWKGHGSLSGKKWADIKNSAKKRNIKFDITIGEAWDLFRKQNEKCFLTGIDISIDEQFPYGTASLDRINSSKGYVTGNVQWVHKDVNMMKQSFEQTYFINLCKLITENFNV